MKQPKPPAFLLGVIISVCSQLVIAAPPKYRVIEILPPAGYGRVTNELDINNKNEVLGTACESPNSCLSPRAFVWTPASGAKVVDYVPAGVAPNAINDGGTIVGLMQIVPGDWRRTIAFVARPGMEVQTIAAEYSDAFALNEDNQVVGAQFGMRQWYGDGFYWNPNTGLETIQPVFHPVGINSSRLVAGTQFVIDSSCAEPRVLNLNTGVWQNLGHLRDRDYCLETEAQAINDNGFVVGTAEVAFGRFHAFIWDAKRGMRDLAKDSPGGGSKATDISNFEQVVGSHIRYGVFYWDEYSGMLKLGTLISKADPYRKRISFASYVRPKINDFGNIVVKGRVDNEDLERAFYFERE